MDQGDENGKGYGRPRGCSGTERQSWLDNLKLRPGTEFEKQQLDIDFSEETYLKYSSKGMDGRYIAHNRYSDMVPGKKGFIYLVKISKRSCSRLIELSMGSRKAIQWV